MDNEAASVPDAKWAHEARLTARQLQPLPLLLELALPALALLLNGVILSTLMSAAIRSEVMRQYDPLGLWLMERLNYGALIELHYFGVPLILGLALGLGRFRPVVLALMGAASTLLCSAGAWIYTVVHGPLSYLTTEGLESVNFVRYASGGGWFRILLTAALVWLGAVAALKIRAHLSRRVV